ncbi:hypothetical protein [Mycobacterium paraintracellulare]|uniref:hypothetical protein n=1 Tax=Mycobacterium paraintracellulare TaxID=1138383 RepID=UPI001F19586F|nr:hypothetical protein [Mycobacterium paraintracellulare]
MAEHGYDPVYGARHLRRPIAHEVDTRIGRAMLRDEIAAAGSSIQADVDGDELSIGYSAVVAAD